MLPVVFNDDKTGPHLPPELEREIFELVLDVCPADLVRLCSVAQRVKIWIERIVYHTIVLDLPLSRTRSFLRAINARRPEFFATHVKKLYMTTMVTSHDALRIMKVCTGVTELAWWSAPKAGADLINIPSCLTRLSINTETFTRIIEDKDFVLSALTHLTHLDLVAPTYAIANSQIWSLIFNLPELTHIAIGNVGMEHLSLLPFFRSMLDVGRLKVLVLITRDDDFVEALDDDRVVIKPSFHHPKDPCKFWTDVRESKGKEDFWSVVV